MKAFGSYPLPGDFVVRAVFQDISGPPITASYAASNSEIVPSLGRNLAACGTRVVCTNTVLVPLIVPQTMFDDWMSRLDVRLAKRVQLTQRVRLQANINIYNVFNGNAVRILNTTYGSQWLQPSLIEDGRMVQFNSTLSF